MPLIKLAWSQLVPCEQPFRWLATAPGSLLDADVAAMLADQFPMESFTRRDGQSSGSDKKYSNYSRTLAGPGVPADAGRLPEIWQALVGEVLADGYRCAVASVLGQKPAAALEVRLVRHAGTDWLSPHTDRADKAFSHIVYLNPQWRREWGGCLQILGGNDPADVRATVVPELGVSALLERSASSWHQITPVAADAGHDRRSLLIHGLN